MFLNHVDVCEPREVREPLRVDLILRGQQVVDGELVEEQVYDRRSRLDRRGRGLHGRREDELLDPRVEQERREEDQRRRRQDRQKRPHDLHAPRSERERDADRDRAGDEHHGGVDAAPLERLHAEDRAQKAEKHAVQHGGVASRDELDDDLDREKEQRGDERDDEREKDDVAGRRAAHLEELRVLAEDVEERLRQGEPGDSEQLRAADERLAKAMRGPSAGLRDGGCVFRLQVPRCARCRIGRPVPFRTPHDRSRDAHRPSCAAAARRRGAGRRAWGTRSPAPTRARAARPGTRDRHVAAITTW